MDGGICFSKADLLKNRRCSGTRSLFISYLSTNTIGVPNHLAPIDKAGRIKKSANSKPFRSPSPFDRRMHPCANTILVQAGVCHYFSFYHSFFYISIFIFSAISAPPLYPCLTLTHLLRIRHFYLKQRRQKMHRRASPLVLELAY